MPTPPVTVTAPVSVVVLFVEEVTAIPLDVEPFLPISDSNVSVLVIVTDPVVALTLIPSPGRISLTP